MSVLLIFETRGWRFEYNPVNSESDFMTKDIEYQGWQLNELKDEVLAKKNLLQNVSPSLPARKRYQNTSPPIAKTIKIPMI